MNQFQANLYTNQNEDGDHYPLFAREIKAAFKVMGQPGAAPSVYQPVPRAAVTATSVARMSLIAGSPRKFQPLVTENPMRFSGLSWRGRPLVDYLKELHAHNALKYYLVPGLFLVVFFIVVQCFFCGSIYPWALLGTWPANWQMITSLIASIRWVCLILLAFSGVILFYNNMSLLFFSARWRRPAGSILRPGRFS